MRDPWGRQGATFASIGASSASISVRSAAASVVSASTAVSMAVARSRPSTGTARLSILLAQLGVGQRIVRIAAIARRLRAQRPSVAQREAHARPALGRKAARQFRRLRAASSPRSGARRADRRAAVASLRSRRRGRRPAPPRPGSGRLYCASSVVAGCRHCEPRSIASRKLSMAMAVTSSRVERRARAAATAPPRSPAAPIGTPDTA